MREMGGAHSLQLVHSQNSERHGSKSWVRSSEIAAVVTIAMTSYADTIEEILTKYRTFPFKIADGADNINR
jgi:hypothetical protein